MSCIARCNLLLMVVVVVVVVVQCAVLTGATPIEEIYNMDHYREVVLTRRGDNRTRVSSVFVQYQTDCMQEAGLLRQQLMSIISPAELRVVFHNEEQSVANTWYRVTSGERLSEYFPIEGCTTVYAVPHGYQLTNTFDSDNDNQLLMWHKQGDVVDWVWSHLKVKVTLRNERSEGVIFLFYGQRVVRKAVFVKHESSTTAEAYVGNFVTVVSAAGDFFFGWKLHSSPQLSATELSVSDAFAAYPGENENAWLADASADYYARDALTRERLQCDSRRHLLNLKQPLLVRNYTAQGYHKTTMPAGVHTAVMQYYREHHEHRTLENWTHSDTNINQYDTRSLMVPLPQHLTNIIYTSLQPVLQHWCNCTLEPQALYGIREYYHGHVLWNHVDRIHTHAISAIIQVDKDLDGEEDWLLEVIGYDGERKQMSLSPGEMLLYESAKLIHGRPAMLRGRVYANVFVHYRPVGLHHPWSYDNVGNTLSDGQGTVMDLYPLPDAYTQQGMTFS